MDLNIIKPGKGVYSGPGGGDKVVGGCRNKREKHHPKGFLLMLDRQEAGSYIYIISREKKKKAQPNPYI